MNHINRSWQEPTLGLVNRSTLFVDLLYWFVIYNRKLSKTIQDYLAYQTTSPWVWFIHQVFFFTTLVYSMSYNKTTARAAKPTPGTTNLPAFPVDSLAETETELAVELVEPFVSVSPAEFESSNNLLLYHGNPVANARISLFWLLSKSVVNESSVYVRTWRANGVRSSGIEAVAVWM